MFKTLIVEDHAEFRRSFSLILSSRFPFLSLAEADSGKKALEQVMKFNPNLVFMDIGLPDGNGLALTKSIKAYHANIAVIMVTAYDMPEYRQAAIEAGASHFLPKGSLSEEKVLTLVESVLADSPSLF